jgi:hypothetical protein
MDGFSAGASVIAVISLALQRTGCVKDLYEFWSSIRGASDALQAIVDNLKLLSTIAPEIASQRSHCSSSPTMKNVVQECKYLWTLEYYIDLNNIRIADNFIRLEANRRASSNH